MSTVLFEDGPWRICRTGLGDSSAIYHHCGDEYDLSQDWWHIGVDDQCAYCQVAVPAEIQGLLILHQWDR